MIIKNNPKRVIIKVTSSSRYIVVKIILDKLNWPVKPGTGCHMIQITSNARQPPNQTNKPLNQSKTEKNRLKRWFNKFSTDFEK